MSGSKSQFDLGPICPHKPGRLRLMSSCKSAASQAWELNQAIQDFSFFLPLLKNLRKKSYVRNKKSETGFHAFFFFLQKRRFVKNWFASRTNSRDIEADNWVLYRPERMGPEFSCDPKDWTNTTAPTTWICLKLSYGKKWNHFRWSLTLVGHFQKKILSVR